LKTSAIFDRQRLRASHPRRGLTVLEVSDYTDFLRWGRNSA
jgi:hypothetical protein